MTSKSKKLEIAKYLLIACTASALFLGCAGMTSGRVPPGADFSQDSAASVPLNGAELWAETCNRCHNFRSPASQTDAHWNVIMMHMRVRANLTGAEARAILAYLKSAN
jgi:hypothetical protein